MTNINEDRREPIKCLADIIQKEMELADGYVMLENQRWKIPKPGPRFGEEGEGEGPYGGADIYIVLSYVSSKVLGTRNYMEEGDNGIFVEVQETSLNQLIQIDIMSFGAMARVRKEEIVMALNSFYSQNSQELNSFQIARVPQDFTNVSALEEAAMLNRYAITVAVNSVSRKKKADSTDYYDQFETPEVKVNG